MPLSDDQKAMLRLLAGGQSYEDIAALMGLSVAEVASRARGAVAQLESEGIPAPALPEAPDDVAAPEQTAEQPVAAEAPTAKPTTREQPPAPPSDPAPTSPLPPPTAKKAPGSAGGRDRGLILAIGGGVLALVVIVVLAILLISNSDGDGGGDTTSAASGSDSGTVVGSRKPTTAQLQAVDGSGASGSAEFGRVEESLALGIDAEGLEPTVKGQLYMVWLAESRRKMLPLVPVAADENGKIESSYEVPTEAVIYLASGDFDRLVITRVRNPALRKSLEVANQQKKFPVYTGDAVLEGPIEGPILGAAKRIEERQQERKEGE